MNRKSQIFGSFFTETRRIDDLVSYLVIAPIASSILAQTLKRPDWDILVVELVGPHIEHDCLGMVPTILVSIGPPAGRNHRVVAFGRIDLAAQLDLETGVAAAIFLADGQTELIHADEPDRVTLEVGVATAKLDAVVRTVGSVGVHARVFGIR